MYAISLNGVNCDLSKICLSRQYSSKLYQQVCGREWNIGDEIRSPVRCFTFLLKTQNTYASSKLIHSRICSPKNIKTICQAFQHNATHISPLPTSSQWGCSNIIGGSGGSRGVVSRDPQLVPCEGRQIPERVGVSVPGQMRGGGTEGGLRVGAVLNLPADDRTSTARPRV